MNKVTGTLYIYFLELPQGYNFFLDTDLTITLQEFRENGAISVLDITGTISSSISDYDSYLLDKIKKFLNIINFYYNTSPKEFFFNYVVAEGKKTKVIGELSVFVTGKLKLADKDLIPIQEKQLHGFSEEQLLCLNFYRLVTTTDDNCAQYWYLYTIASILLGERECIDRYFIDKLSSPVIFSDFDKKKIAEFVFMRDLFSHRKKTSNGIGVNREKFLKAKILEFRKQVKQLMTGEILNF